jgi:catechol 2,3-dioxygenase-like lactoylglutathione lyase family enzyme
LLRCTPLPSVASEVVALLSGAPVYPSIPATDLERAKRFYRDTLGLAFSMEMDEGLRFDCGGTSLHVYPTRVAGQAGHTLAAWSVNDLDAEMADLRARGITFEDYDLPGLSGPGRKFVGGYVVRQAVGSLR